jgi:DNA-binding response OmpR family regulator
MTLLKNGARIEIRKKLFDLLLFFVRKSDSIISAETLYECAWNASEGINANSLYVHINQLRLLIEEDAANPRYITTVRNAGYRYSVRTPNSI